LTVFCSYYNSCEIIGVVEKERESGGLWKNELVEDLRQATQRTHDLFRNERRATTHSARTLTLDGSVMKYT
jgi:hypothetical protein